MRRKKSSPAYQWYPNDYLTDAIVMQMTLEQEGAYRRLIDICWINGGLPTDMDLLWRLANAPNKSRMTHHIWPGIKIKFHRVRGMWRHKRVDRERAKQSKYRRAMQLNGLKGGRPRKAAGLFGKSRP